MNQQLIFETTDGGTMVGTTLLVQHRLTGKVESAVAKRFDKDGTLTGYVVVVTTREIPVEEYTTAIQSPRLPSPQ